MFRASCGVSGRDMNWPRRQECFICPQVKSGILGGVTNVSHGRACSKIPTHFPSSGKLPTIYVQQNKSFQKENMRFM